MVVGMDVVLTGGTGLIGAAVLRSLLEEGHRVTALVRSESSAAVVSAAGATPLLGDMSDGDWLARALSDAQGAIHAASPGDASSAAFDAGVAAAAVGTFAELAGPMCTAAASGSTAAARRSPSGRPSIRRR